jgi:protein ImuA
MWRMPPVTLAIPPSPVRSRCRTEVLEELRRLLPKLEGGADTGALAFGIAALDSHLPQGGLAFGTLHEVAPATDGDLPAAFGFLVALLGRMPRTGPLILVLPTRSLVHNGRPHGHGLNGLGLDPTRLILVETADERTALWALEEALHSAAPVAVAGAIEKLDLKMSQRLHLAAGACGLPLLLLRPARMLEASAATTRWRVGTTAAERDRFGLIARAKWRLRLERARNGRPGEWLVEYDHVAHRFSLAAALADPAFPRSAGAQPSQPQPLVPAGRSATAIRLFR